VSEASAARPARRPGWGRRRAPAVALVGLAVGCASEAPLGGYLDDARVRRAALEASLIEPTNAYSRRRLEHYATGRPGDWDDLPVLNPRVSAVTPAELVLPGGAADDAPLGPDARAFETEGVTTPEAWLALGEEAFFRYPAEVLTRAKFALRSPESAERYGFWVDERRGVGGLVRVELPDGDTALALSCASCHAAPRPGLGLVVGVGNDRLDLGGLVADAAGGGVPSLGWGPGRVDVSTATGGEPVRIPDLRPTRWLTHLQHAGAVAQHDMTSLAVRIETLIITSNGGAIRPPREVALGLATFLWSLSPASPPATTLVGPEARGEAIFGERCARCHAPPGFAGPPVSLDEVGTEPTIARSPDRGTGRYRVPSLRGVGSRGPLLHDAAAPSLDVLFDPERVSADFAGSARGGPVVGHPFGLDLDVEGREALLAYLRTL
jgi:cytochrome c5